MESITIAKTDLNNQEKDQRTKKTLLELMQLSKKRHESMPIGLKYLLSLKQSFLDITDKLIDKTIEVFRLPIVDMSMNHNYYSWGGNRDYGLSSLVVWYIKLMFRNSK